jgi:hypothetical protein
MKAVITLDVHSRNFPQVAQFVEKHYREPLDKETQFHTIIELAVRAMIEKMSEESGLYLGHSSAMLGCND